MALNIANSILSAPAFPHQLALLADPSQWDLSPDNSHTAGQATAIGISAGGISAKQLDTLKTRLETTKGKLEAKDTTHLTGEQISGDLLTATIWSWFAAAESHNRLSQSQAGVIENPGLSYGLFHAVANPISSWGVVRKVTFPGVNIDIGHIRNITWAKDNDEKKWVSYNRLRGQYMSALEHAVPERFFNDPSLCNSQGNANPIAGLPECPQGISAVKALGIAAAQGQKIYTITQKVYNDNPNIVSSALAAHSYDTQNRVQNALDVGYEVTIHEAPITQSGWSGAGFTIIDPNTGAGAYTIEGGSNGGVFIAATVGVVGWYLLSAGVGAPLIAALMIAFAIHLAIICLLELQAEGLFDLEAAFVGGTAALSLLRALSTFLAGTALAFAVPGGMVMGIILIALAVLAFSRVR